MVLKSVVADKKLARDLLAEFARRDPYSNPDGFTREFERLEREGWIERVAAGRYRVAERARAAVEAAVRAGDDHLETVETLPVDELDWFATQLRRIDEANLAAPEPPRQWATLRRFRVPVEDRGPLPRVREYAMNLFGYRDDSHRAAWDGRPGDGRVWNACTFVWSGEARTASEIASQAAFRGYVEADYERALRELVALGWIEAAEDAATYRMTVEGRSQRDEIERLTDEYFYAPWAVLSDAEVERLSTIAERLLERLASVLAGD